MRISNRLRAIRSADKQYINDVRYGDGWRLTKRTVRVRMIGRGPYAAWLPRRNR